MNSFHLRHILFVTLCVAPLLASAQNDSVSQSVTLSDVVISGNKYTSDVITKNDGTIVLDMKLMDALPHVFGNADPMHYAQMLPGIQTNGEYRSGINIQGCENSHNDISIGYVPIYNVNHLFGLFSTFNSSHYPTLTIHKSAVSSQSPSRLGGALEMDFSTDHPSSFEGEVSLGLISSQTTMKVPLSDKLSFTASLRGSYINLLYRKWLRDETFNTKYSFYDSNFTLLYTPNSSHTLAFDYYGGDDFGSFFSTSYWADMKVRWGNQMGAIHHRYTGENGLNVSNVLYLSSYHNGFTLNMDPLYANMPSSISDIGYKGAFAFRRLSGGIDMTYHSIHPQSVAIEGTANTVEPVSIHDKPVEMSVFVDYTHPFSSSLTAMMGIRGNLFAATSGCFISADPSVSVAYEKGPLQLRASYSLRHQYLFNTGFSDIGLPTEFWMSSSRTIRPQYAHTFMLNAYANLFSGRYRLSADIFYKQLYNQVEYTDNVFDFINTEYHLEDNIVQGSGHTYGFSLMLTKCVGSLTGWVGYTFTRSRRTFTEGPFVGTFPTSHERPHELNGVVTYTLNSHWNFGATFVCASGTPFTSATLAVINDYIMLQYQKYNSSRLKPYCRLDLSATYKWHTRLFKENGLNLSFYNATCRHNELYYFLSIDNSRQFNFKPGSFFFNILPSISYFCKF